MSFSGANFLQRSSWDIPVRPSTLVGGKLFHWISQVSPGQQLTVPCWPRYLAGQRGVLPRGQTWWNLLTSLEFCHCGSVPGSDGNPGFQPVFIFSWKFTFVRFLEGIVFTCLDTFYGSPPKYISCEAAGLYRWASKEDSTCCSTKEGDASESKHRAYSLIYPLVI